MPKLVNYYIQLPDERHWVKLESLLSANGYVFYDATEYDSCTSGACQLASLEDIQKALKLAGF